MLESDKVILSGTTKTIDASPSKSKTYIFPSYSPIAAFDQQLMDVFVDAIFGEIVNGSEIQVLSVNHHVELDEDFAHGIISQLLRAKVVVLIFSKDAISSLMNLQENSPINRMLLEWTLILELYVTGKLDLCVPILLGDLHSLSSESDVLNEIRISLDEIPDVKCNAVMSLVRQVLEHHNLQSSIELSGRTVRSLGKEICLFNGVTTSVYKALDSDRNNENFGSIAGFARACAYTIAYEVTNELTRSPGELKCDVYPTYNYEDFGGQFVKSFRNQIMMEQLHGKALSVFNDKKDLRKGRNFALEIVSFVSSAKIAVPIITIGCLRRLKFALSTQYKSILLEWWLMLELKERRCYPNALNIMPVLIGELVNASNANGSFASDAQCLLEVVDQLPVVVCEPVMQLVNHALYERKLLEPPLAPFLPRTVKDIVTAILSCEMHVDASGYTPLDCDESTGWKGSLEGFEDALADGVVRNVMTILHSNINDPAQATAAGALEITASESMPRTELVGRFAGSMRSLSLARSSIAVRGIKSLVGAGNQLYDRLSLRGIDVVVEEVQKTGIEEDVANLEYILNHPACNELSLPAHVKRDIERGWYHGGPMKAVDYDYGHVGLRFSDFCNHENSRAAGLIAAEVLALRLYTTSSYPRIIEPLRQRVRPHPWRMTVIHLSEGIRKLRAVDAMQNPGSFLERKALWRGMKNVVVAHTEEFTKYGGTELAPLSTTESRSVAENYAASEYPLLFRFDTRGPNRGCSLAYLSVYPKEKEYLYPPLTLLTPQTAVLQKETGSKYTVVAVDPGIV